MNLSRPAPVFRPAACVLLALAGSVSAVQAQSMKPGLWEQRFTMKTSSGQMEQEMAKAQAELARLPADQRKMVEQMMAQRGMSLSNQANTVKICLSPQQAAQLDVPTSDSQCQQKITQRSRSSIKTSFSCSGPPPSSGESEINFKGDTAYSGRSVVNTTVQGRPERVNMDISGQWLGADCGTLKPAQR
ncbi:MAG: DUF3617 domain-containing protein [Rubrivivax sp.]|nr:DUF3617 domain-containing protein [Rubrivivax sp.]